MSQSIPRKAAKRMVGPGWSGLIDLVYDTFPDFVEVTTVKEKWGGLRIYILRGSTQIHDMLEAVERVSLTICEFCGKSGEPRGEGWVKTLCDECSDEMSNL